jgi:protocatechuate 3,4-dioxygenase beta subunit
MARLLTGIYSFFFCLAAAAAPPPPLRLTGRILPPVPADTRVELFSVVSSYPEAVRFLRDETVPPLASAQPRADGSFEIQAPESGLYRVRLRAEGRLPIEALLIPLVEETELPPVALQSVLALQITVLRPDGQPVPGLRLRALSVEAFGLGAGVAWRPAQSEGITDPAGNLTLPQGGNGKLSFVALAPGAPDRFVEAIDGTLHTLRLTWKEPRIVEVRGQDGKALPGLLVRWNLMPFGLTGSDGRLALPAATSGATLRLEDASGFLAEVPVPPEEKGTIAVRLPAGRTVAGRVLDAATRKPLPGALVWSDGHRAVRADVEGRFRIQAFSGAATVDAAAAGHLPSSAEARPGDGQPLTFALPPATALDGVVTDGSGRPVAGAEVQARSASSRFRDETPEISARSGADGRFHLASLAIGQMYEVAATRAGFAAATLSVEAVPAGKSVPLRIVLRHGSSVAGRIMDREGRPVAGAELILHPASRRGQSWEGETTARSDSAGRFELGDLGPGRFDLQATHHGFAPTTVHGVEIPTAPRTVDLGEMTLVPGAVIEGRVTDRRGAPVAQAEIDFGCSDFFPMGRPRSAQSQPAATGPDGRFRFEDLAPESSCSLIIRHAGYTTARLPGVKAPTSEPLRVELAAARVLNGRVVGPLGEPVQGASIDQIETRQIRLGGSGSGMTSSESGGRTDAEGRFQLNELAAGPVDLIVSAEGYKRRTLNGIEAPEAGGPELAISLEKGEALTGKVVDSHGEPVAAAALHALPEEPLTHGSREVEAVTDGDGRYRLEGLETGRYSVQAESPDGQSVDTSAEIRPGVNRLDLAFPGGTDVTGRVLDRDGIPVPGATASLLTAPSGRIFHAVAAAEGWFHIRAVPDGDYLLAGAAEGFSSTLQPGEIHIAGQAVQGLELRLDRGTVLTGRLLGIKSEEISIIQASTRPGSGPHAWKTGTAEGESYRISGLSPGAWEVTAFTSGDRNARGSVVIEPGMDRATLDLEWATGFTLSGRVLLDNAPLADAHILIQGPEAASPSGGRTVTAWDGSFRFPGLRAGRHVVAVAGHGGIGFSQDLEISGDREITIEISTGAVSGQVLSAAGAPVAGALVSLFGEKPGENPDLASGFQGPAVRSGEQGSFELPHLAAGSYRVKVRAEGFADAENRIVVTPGGMVRMEVVLKEAPGKGEA